MLQVIGGQIISVPLCVIRDGMLSSAIQVSPDFGGPAPGDTTTFIGYLMVSIVLGSYILTYTHTRIDFNLP